MTKPKARTEIAALRQIALDDLAETTDAQLRQEAIEEGEDLGAVAAQVRSVMMNAAANVSRKRLAQARERMLQNHTPPLPCAKRPLVERIKEIIQGLPVGDRRIAMAFRDGKTQTDADWESLYDDLVEMGVIDLDHPDR
jgi:hypothetical protein